LASLNKIEGELIEGGLILGGLVLLYVIWKAHNIQVPYSAYPDAIGSTIAAGADRSLSDFGMGSSTLKTQVDHFFGGLVPWLSANLPSYVDSKSWKAYDAANTPDDSSLAINGNDGTNVDSYDEGGS
jgi:hypothetical protein